MIHNKKDSKLPEYTHQLQILNQFSNFIDDSDLNSTTKENAHKVVDCLKFIKINLEFIGDAVENRGKDDSIYTFPEDKSKGVIRDFNNTAMHFNSYNSKKLVQAGLKNLVEQFEQAIEAMQEKGELDAFAKKLQFDGDVGCIEARTAAALSFAATRLSSVVHSLDDRMEEFYSLSQNENDPNIIVNKAMEFFKPWMGQQAIWGNIEYVISSALIKRYLTEILVVDLPAEDILDELKKEESSQHHSALVASINLQELADALLTPEYGLNFLKIISLNQPSPVVLALLNKIDNDTIKKLLIKNPSVLKIEFLQLLLKNHSPAIGEALLEKLSGEGINYFKSNYKDMLPNQFRKAIRIESFLIYRVMKYIDNEIVTHLEPDLFNLTLVFLITLIAAIISLTLDIIRVLVYTPLSTYYKFNNSTQSLLNDILALQSPRLLALFFSNLPSQQLNTLNFPLIDQQKHLPHLLFTSNLSIAPEIEDTFYDFWYSNSALRALLIDNEYPLLTQCIDDYFEDKLARPHPKIILLFEECLAEKAKKQGLFDKEQAFLADLKQENQVFPHKSLEEIWLNGVESWSYYRHLRQQKENISIQILLDRLLLKRSLFGGGWSNENFTKYLCDFKLKQETEQRALATAKSCIRPLA